MRYAVVTEPVVLGIAKGLVSLVIEIDPSGYVGREVGFDSAGVLRHRTPSTTPPFGEYGILGDGPPMDIDVAIRHGNVREITQAEFEAYWARSEITPDPADRPRRKV